MERRDRGEDFRWYEKRGVRPMEDFNRQNEVGIFAGPLESMYSSITKDVLKALTERGERLTILSISPPGEFEKGHICGSINIPLPFIERDSIRLLGKDDLIVVYASDSKSQASAVGVDKLRTLSFKNAVRFKGGLEEWKKAGYCVEGRAPGKAA